PDLRVLVRRDQVLQGILRLVDDVEGLINGLLEIRHLRLASDDIDRGKLALLDKTLVVLVLLFRILNAVPLDLKVAKRKGEVPVSPLNVNDRLDGLLPKLCIREREVSLGDLDDTTLLIEPAALEERLSDREAGARVVLRREDRDRVVRRDAVVRNLGSKDRTETGYVSCDARVAD